MLIRLTALVLLVASIASAETPKPSRESSVAGVLETVFKACTGGRTEVWLSQGSELIYQIEVPMDGSFELHAVPGEYLLTATNSEGCFQESRVKLEAEKTTLVKLALEPTLRSPAAAQAGGEMK